jgi:sugar O-acyltransferase (sialic acid O-acetyltransferase NeuD family)
MAKVVVFGTRDIASLAHFYLVNDSLHEVVAFTVHERYMESQFFEGRPVVPFEEVETHYPPNDFRFFAPMSERDMSRARERVFDEALGKGYEFISYVSSKATAFSPVGRNCFILEDNTIQPYQRIGDNVVMWSGNHIGHHGAIKDHVFFTSHVVLSGHCTVEPHCFFGVNCTIRNGLHIAEGTLVSMGALVTKDTTPWGVYVGAPAKWQRSSEDMDFLA